MRPTLSKKQSAPKTKRPSTAKGKPGAGPKLAPEAEAWVQRTLRKMTLREKLGQLLMLPCHGRFMSTDSAEMRELLHQVRQNHIGGILLATRRGALGLEKSGAYPAAALANALQTAAKIPLLLAGDFEHGTAMRITEGTSFPHAMAVAATGRTEDAYTVGRITAIEARAIGAPWVFAPVADVNNEPDNPMINIRSFGEDPKRVAEFVTAYVRGVEENGALATAKHFPGHGNTTEDSHTDLPTVASDRGHLDRMELVPFRASVAAHASTFMTGHLAVPALEPDPKIPVTLSKNILTDLLRQEMGFRGLVVTDSLDMAGVSERFSPAEAAVQSLLAGSDVLLLPPVPEAALAGLREAVHSGRLPIARVDEAVTRILRAKAHIGLHKTFGGSGCNRKQLDLGVLPETLARPEFMHAAQEIADRGITLLRDNNRVLPLDAARPTRVLLISIAGDPDRYPGEDFENELRWRVDSLQALRFDTRFASVSTLQMPSADSYDVMIVALFVRVVDRKGSVGLPDDQVEVVRRLLSKSKSVHGKPVIVACFGSPYLVARFPEASTWLAAFSSADVAQRAAARTLFGQAAIGGRIPVTVPGAAAAGDGLDVPTNPMKLVRADAAMEAALRGAYKVLDEAVAGRAFPGAVVAVGYKGVLAVHGAGKQSYEARSPKVTATTIYDLASITKPMVTATLAAMLCEAGELDLDAPVEHYIREWCASSVANERSRVTVRHLLTHTSGLGAHEEFFRTMRSRRAIVDGVIAQPLRQKPGEQSVYSDIGFIVLGEIIERLTGRTLDALARERIFTPLEMHDTWFKPGKALRTRIAPTEKDVRIRQRLVHGEVHDENAWAMGGVAGHAGVFATAGDVAIWCQMVLNGGIYAHRRLLRRETVTLFTAPSPLAAGTRTLGWMTPTPNSSSGRYFSPASFGHLGYVGTSVWTDSEKQLFVALLTNRVHPTRENDQIQQVRPALHDAVVEGLGLA